MLKARHQADDRADHYEVYSGQVRIITIYNTTSNPTGREWFGGT